MYVDNILKEIEDLIYANNRNWDSVFKAHREVEKFSDLSDAIDGLNQAADALCMVDERLKQLVGMIEMEALSHKVQSK